MFDDIAKQYLAGLKSDGSGYADQPNSHWQTSTPGNDDFYRGLAMQGGGNVVDWSKLGYNGQLPTMGGATRNDAGEVTGYAPGGVSDEFKKFVDDNKIGRIQGTNAQNFSLNQLTQNGQPIPGASMSTAHPNDDAFNVVRGIVNTGLLGGAGYAALGAGAGSGGAAYTGGATAGGGATGAAADFGAGTYGAGAAGAAEAGGTAAGASSFAPGGFQFGGGAAGGGGAAAGGGGMAGGGASSFAPNGFEFGGAAGDGGASPGFMSSLTSGNFGDAATAAGNWATSTNGLQTLGGLGSAFMQNHAAGKALGAQTDATNSANALQKYQYDTTRADYAPYRQAGSQAVGQMSNLLANPNSITQDPGYQFGLDQGVQGVDRSAASKGSLYSGATLKALQRYGTDYGTTKLNDTFNRLGSVAQLGATGTAGTAQAGSNYANQFGANTTGLGNAGAGNALYQGNVWGNALNGAVSAYINPPPKP